MKFVTLFSSLTKKDADIAGGKGASLGEMMNAGISVPDGFVVLSSTFDDFIEQADLTAEIEAILESVDHKAIHTVDEASEKIQLLIKKTVMPKPIATEVLSSFKELESPFVAVRSSATAEDGADHAWAGQLDSYLNTTEDALLTRVQECWASLFTPRAIFYRFEKGLHDTHISVAVVVQKMVNSEVSGIAFSVHPVTEDRNQLIIEAGFGLGEAIVSGSITPDSYVVEKEPRRIIDINISTQERKLIRKEEGGNEWVTIPEPEASSQVLTENQITELAQIIIGIENHYGFPCDIEWAFEAGKFYIVQSRPITTLQIDNSDIEKWKVVAGDFNAPFIKSYCTALGYAGHLKEHDFVHLVGCVGRDFDIDYIILSSTWDSAHAIMKQRVTENPRYLEKIINDIEHFGVNFNIWSESHLMQADLKSHSNTKLIELLETFIQKQSYLYTKGTVFSILDYGKFSFFEGNLNEIFNSKLKTKNDKDEAFEVFTTPISHSFQIEQEIELKEILVLYQKDPSFIKDIISQESDWLRKKYPDFWKKLSSHTKKYSWLFYSYMGPAYTEEDFLLIVKDIFYQKVNIINDLEKYNKSNDYIKEKRDIFINKIKPTSFEKIILNTAEKMVWAKPRRKDYQSKSYYHLSFLLNEIAVRLNLSLEEVFACSVNMLKEGLIKKFISKNEIEFVRKLYVIIPTKEGKVEIYFHEDAEDFCQNSIAKETKVQSTGQLKGMIAYKGQATGIVKIINKSSEMDKMNSGDVLVALATTPAIVPAMKKASAIITDKGGLTCHAAIVARELKVPCIVGTEIATQILKDGIKVEVDANNGIIMIL